MTNASTVRTYAKATGLLLLISLVAGGFGEAYAPTKIIVSSDAAATAKNIASGSLFRVGFACYLVEAVCDISLALLFFLLLRPVGNALALLSAFFGLVSTALFAVAEFFYFAASLLVGGAGYLKSFSPAQLNSLALLSLKTYALGGVIFMVFYGTATLLRGYLMYRSGYLPKFLGVLLMIAGLSFIANNFIVVLAPKYASDFFAIPVFIALLAMIPWFLIKGVDIEKWELASAANG